MNSLHGIKLQNDEVAVRGQSLTFRKRTGQLVLNGEALTRCFNSRRDATKWAEARGAKVSPV
jgi:hypothetical protein